MILIQSRGTKKLTQFRKINILRNTGEFKYENIANYCLISNKSAVLLVLFTNIEYLLLIASTVDDKNNYIKHLIVFIFFIGCIFSYLVQEFKFDKKYLNDRIYY